MDYNDEYVLGLTFLIGFRNCWRTTSAEKRELDRLNQNMYEDVRHAAEIHRQVRLELVNNITVPQVRYHIQSVIKPGIKLFDLCEQIEAMTRKLSGERGYNSGKQI